MAIIHTNISAQSYAILENLLPDESEADFDRGTMAILYRGTEAQLRAAFPKGSSTNYPGSIGSGTTAGTMICAGVRVTRSRFGFLWATVEWTGLIKRTPSLAIGGVSLQYHGASNTFDIKSCVNNATTYEIALPQTIPGGGTVEGVGQYNATSVALQRQRQRVINLAMTRDYSGILIVTRNAPPAVPKLLGGTRPAGLSNEFNGAKATDTAALAVSQCNYFDGINKADTGGGGWCCRNFQAASARILGDWLLIKWTASFEWIDRFSV